MTVKDFALLRRAHGRLYADALHDALVSVCVSASPTSRVVGSVDGGSVVILGSNDGVGLDTTLVEERIADRTRGADDDSAPILDASTGTLSSHRTSHTSSPAEVRDSAATPPATRGKCATMGVLAAAEPIGR